MAANDGNNYYTIQGAGTGEGVGMSVDNVAFYQAVDWGYIEVGG